MTDDLAMWLDQQLENQRLKGETLKTMAYALPGEAARFLTQTGDFLIGDVYAKRRVLDDAAEYVRNGAEAATDGMAVRVREHLALAYAEQDGYREEWRPT
ncbi:DUF6221 family protein [Micromonospora haikouensis]|uniref:DUF6221 family protein n=1 Tax=Micromonospora haikouensis TaxID=686309 RepID=UPI003680B122